MKIKVCGMRDQTNIEALTSLQPDYMGFIFWAPSTRYVNEPSLKLTESIKKTGVFVNASVDYIQTMISEHHLQAVQLHGEETPNYCQLVQTFGVEVIKAFSIKDEFNFTTLTPFENSCNFFLFGREPEKTRKTGALGVGCAVSRV